MVFNRFNTKSRTNFTLLSLCVFFWVVACKPADQTTTESKLSADSEMKKKEASIKKNTPTKQTGKVDFGQVPPNHCHFVGLITEVIPIQSKDAHKGEAFKKYSCRAKVLVKKVVSCGMGSSTKLSSQSYEMYFPYTLASSDEKFLKDETAKTNTMFEVGSEFEGMADITKLALLGPNATLNLKSYRIL